MRNARAGTCGRSQNGMVALNIESTLRIGALAPGEIRALSEAWQVGAILPVRVIGGNERQVSLMIDGSRVEANHQGNQPLPDAFQARVASNGAQTVLEVLTPASAAMPDGGRVDALRNLMPQQLSQAALLADLARLDPALSNDAVALRTLLPSDVRNALSQLLAALPHATDLRAPQALLRALQFSGTQLEHHLQRLVQVGASESQATEILQGDWKAALLRLLAALNRHTRPQAPLPDAASSPPPLARQALAAQPRLAQSALPPSNNPAADATALMGRMHTHVQGALARIEIAALETQLGTPVPLWLIELPLRGTDGFDMVQMRIFRDPGDHPAGTDSQALPWRLSFALDLPSLGVVEGDVAVRAQRVQVQLRAARAAAQRELDAALPQLAATLSAAGLMPEKLSCTLGLRERGRLGSGGLLNATA